MSGRYVLALDVGGTFTDLIRYDVRSGELATLKVASTPPDFLDGMLDAIAGAGVTPAEVQCVKIGTTIATNTIIMRLGARTGLLTTQGFRDVLHAGRAARPNLYDSEWDPAPPLVPRELTLTVHERSDYQGDERSPLDEAGVREAARVFRAADVEAVAVSFLHAYRNPTHEARARDILIEELPGAFICTSSETLAEIREFERTSTTVANAYLGPILGRYLNDLARRLMAWGYDGPTLITHSGGGVMSVESAATLPARICQSGPAAGVMAGALVGRMAGRPSVISLDVGGTSADVSIAPTGRPLVRADWRIEFNIPICFPSVDVVTVGAGGGSIAWIDAGGVLKVGPVSAGADPGPACYGRGGTRPTVTDANLFLGRIGAQTRLAGRVRLDAGLAEMAVHRVAEPLGLSTTEAALGIVRVVEEQMAGGIRLMSVQRGYDPRDFHLVAFGGAGPLHALPIARRLGIPEVIFPYVPGLGSALGVLCVDVRHDFVQSIFASSEQVDPAAVERAFVALERQALERLARDGVPRDRAVLRRYLDVRYYGQISGGLTLPVTRGQHVQDVFRAFRERHLMEFGYVLPAELAELELVNARVTAEGQGAANVELRYAPFDPGRAAPIDRRQVLFAGGEAVVTPVWRRDSLPIGHELVGPCIVEQFDTTVLVPPGAGGRVDERLNLICSAR